MHPTTQLAFHVLNAQSIMVKRADDQKNSILDTAGHGLGGAAAGAALPIGLAGLIQAVQSARRNGAVNAASRFAKLMTKVPASVQTAHDMAYTLNKLTRRADLRAFEASGAFGASRASSLPALIGGSGLGSAAGMYLGRDKPVK